MNNTVLRAKGLTRKFLEAPNEITVLSGVELTVKEGDSVAILGASGSGKSTLLHLLGGLDNPSEGIVQLLGADFSNMQERARDSARNRSLGFVYQFHHLLQEFDAIDNVAMPLMIARVDKTRAREQAKAVLQKVGLGARLHHMPSELSGGERQRVAIARALVIKPKCLLADEPTGNLDRGAASSVFDLMLELTTDQSMSFVVVTHDESLAARCSRRYRLIQGQLEEVS
jgi:lipoprotein-releasing system ATP-binding protein